jgi:hypothetical protein
MAAYHTNELSFDLPEDFKDKTHHIFSLTDAGPSPFNLVISRHPIGDEETLETYGERLASELAQSLPKFELIRSRLILVAGQAGWGLEYRWLNQGQWLHQRQATLFHEADAGARLAVQFTATVAGDFSDRWKQVFADILGSIRLRPTEA